ncbi:MAG: hypothetical protein IJ805_05590 [Lachnospiraceae bacterium]|nr:hypothetical protein [Lachnospiraceae bacterium]
MEGKNTIKELAETYRQLYIAPKNSKAALEYKAVVLNGEEPESKSLSHFITSDRDSCVLTDTPAGKVQVITLAERADFETFLQIMAFRCIPQEIPKTQGASILDGVINWRRIEAHKEEFLNEELKKGNGDPDWDQEFQRFTSDKKNYTDAIIILSVGPYSNIGSSDAGFSKEEWIRYSDTIRRYHECTHFICRRLYPEMIDAIWDELVADAVGLYAAFNRYDLRLAQTFLGIRDGRYVGGRLENYLEKSGEKDIDELSSKVYGVLTEFDGMINSGTYDKAEDVLFMLEEKQSELW